MHRRLPTWLLVAIALYALCAKQSVAADWVIVIASRDQVYELDTASIRSLPDGRLSAWMRSYLRPGRQALAIGEKSYQSTKSLDFYDCVGLKSGIRQAIHYADSDWTDVVNTYSVGEAAVAMSDVVPDSVGEGQLQGVCSRRQRTVGQQNIPPVAGAIDTDWAWDEFRSPRGVLEWECRGMQTGRIASTIDKCKGKLMLDNTWPGPIAPQVR